MHRPILSLAAASFLVCSFGVTPAPAVDTADELLCQLHTAQAIGKFVSKKTKCIMGCYHNAYANEEAPTDCVPPFAGKTNGCVNSSENQTAADITSNCNKDCPECYTNGDCSADADTKIAGAESHVDTLASDLFCDDTGSGDGLTLAEHKCQLAVAKYLSLFHAKKVKCYTRCRKGEIGGKIALGDCSPPPNDLKTGECILKLETKVATLIDNKCESAVNPSADKPDCGLYPSTDGAGRVQSEEAAVDATHASTFCNDF